MSGKTLTGRKFFYIIAGFFLIIFTANGFLAYIAVSTNTGLETENYYEKGIAYDKDITRAMEQDKSGLKVAISAKIRPGRQVRLSVSTKDAAGKPYTGKNVNILFFRPTMKGNDRQVVLKEGEPGIYGGETELPLPGIWDMKLEIRDADKVVYKTRSRVVLK